MQAKSESQQDPVFERKCAAYQWFQDYSFLTSRHFRLAKLNDCYLSIADIGDGHC